jgi:hypothetical protein
VGIIFAIVWVSEPKRWKTLKNIFSNTSPLVFAIPLFMYFISQVVVGVRWWLLLRNQKIKIPLKKAVTLHLLGLFYNVFLPSAVGGDLIRAWYITKHTNHHFEAILSIFVDRVLGFFSMVILAFLAWVIFLRKPLNIGLVKYFDLLSQYKLALILIFAALSLLIIIIIYFARNLTKKLWSRTEALFLKVFQKGKNAAILYRKKPFTIISVILITMASQSILVISFWLLSTDMQISASLKYFLVFFPVSWVLGILPSIGGAVFVEGGLVIMFTQFTAVSAEQAFALALLQRFIWILCGIPGMLVHLKGTHLPDDFSIDYYKNID